MHKIGRLFKYIYYTICFMMFFTVRINAYIDPSVMTYAIQVIAGSAIAIGTLVSLYWRKITKGLRKIFRVRSNHHTNNETDDLYVKEDNKELTYKNISKKEIDSNKNRYLKVGNNTNNNQISSEDNKNKIKNIILELLPAILLVCVLGYMMCYYAPMEIYMNNKREFWFDYDVLLPQTWGMFKGFVAVLGTYFIASFVINKKFYKGSVIVGFICLLILYIHGNYFCTNLPALDGTETDWALYTKEIQISIIICIITIMVVSILVKLLQEKKFYYVVDFCCVLICIMLFISINDISKIKNGKARKTNNYQVTKINEFDYSSDENFIIMVLDAYDAGTFSVLLDEYPEYREIFKDFTYYPDTVGSYSYTSRAIPFILSGQWYENDQSYIDFESKAINESSLLNTLEENGFRLDAYESMFLYDTDMTRYSNVVEYNLSVKNKFQFREPLFNLIMFKYSPYFLKSNFEVPLDSFSSTMNPVSGLEIFGWGDQSFYYDVQNKEVTVSDEKVFKWFHLEGGHVPYSIGPNMEDLYDENGGTTGTYKEKQQGCVTMLKAYLDMLKENDVYDNSTIIIMSDHGYYDSEGEGISNNYRSNPVLMVKARNETNDSINISDLPVSYANLQDMYQNLIKGSSGATCLDGLTDDNYKRRFLYFNYTHEDTIYEYYQIGKANKPSGLKATGKVYVSEDKGDNEG